MTFARRAVIPLSAARAGRRILMMGGVMLVVAATVCIVAPRPAMAAGSPASLTVASQTSWVGSAPANVFKIGLDLGGADSSADRLQVNVYAQLRNRTNFDASLSGRYLGTPRYSQSVSIAALPRSGRAVQLSLPIGSQPAPSAAGPGVLPQVQTVSPQNNGVYPVEITALDDSGRTVGPPVITYLVWVPITTGSPKLDVSLILPVHSPPAFSSAGDPAPLSAGAASGLQTEVSQLDQHTGVPVTLAATPQTLDALAGGSKAEQATVAELGSTITAGGDEVLPEPYAHVDLSGLSTAGLGSEIGPQLSAGASTLSGVLHVSPAATTWALDGPADAPTVADLHGRGASQLIVSDGSLSALPTALQQNTLGRPTHLAGSPVEVFGADAALRAHFTNGGDQVLQANQLLAELAMIETEQPSLSRGVAVLPPDGWQPTAAFLGNVLSGLQGNPLVAPVTAQTLFADVHVATTDDAEGRPQPVTRGLVGIPPAATSPGDANAVRALRSQIGALAQTEAGLGDRIGRLQQRLLVAESSDLDAQQRSAVLASIRRQLSGSLAGIRLPKGVSYTLTSNSGTVPITVQSDVANAHVRLVLMSQKLTFRSFTPPDGSCQVTSSTTEVCELTLSGPSTLLRLPVEARATGVFALNAALWTSDGSVLIGQVRYTVRNTAISGVALALTIGAAVLLLAWWVRDRRHGRRARQLVPAPPAKDSTIERLDELDDPVVAEFFASRPPDYEAAHPDDADRGAGRPL